VRAIRSLRGFPDGGRPIGAKIIRPPAHRQRRVARLRDGHPLIDALASSTMLPHAEKGFRYPTDLKGDLKAIKATSRGASDSL